MLLVNGCAWIVLKMKKVTDFLIACGRPIVKAAKWIGRKFNRDKKQKKVKNKEKTRKIFYWKYPALFVIILTFITGVTWFYQKIIRDLPNINEIYNPPKLSTQIYDRNGKLLYKFYNDENRLWVKFSEIPQDLINATIAAEDKEFYRHHGFSIKGILKAIIYNFKNGSESKLRGGSTITQQLVKNVFLSNEKSMDRKLKEGVLAVLLESKLSKEEILERYFNQVPYGGNVYGVAEAADRYFRKKVNELNLAEMAFLAGLPAAPGSYSPFTEDGYRLAKLRQEHVLDQMVAYNQSISQEKANEAKKVEIKIFEEKKNIEAPHFVFYVKSYLEKMGFNNVDRKGLIVTTTLDLEIQKELEKIVKEEVRKVGKLRISNGASIILDNKSGDVLAMVGSKDYFSTDIDGKFDVVTQGLRQPGSSIKPINYLLALQRGRHLWESVDDTPVTYYIAGQKPYTPKNYTGKFMGRVTLKTALASSLNVPSVKILDENGVENMINLAQKMGITTWEDKSRFGLSLALGAGEVKMIDMAQAYSIFGNLGEKVKVNPVLEVKNYLGEEIYKKTVESERVAGEKETFLINEALSDDRARAPVFGTDSLLNIKDKKVAVKTGTTNSLRDNWCIGWTPSYLVATWVGNNDNSPMGWVASGISGATPIWNQAMRLILENKDNEEWDIPSGLRLENVCGRTEWLSEGESVACFNSITPTSVH